MHLRLLSLCGGTIWLRKTWCASSPNYPLMWRCRHGKDRGPLGCLHHPSEAAAEIVRFTYSRIHLLARWKGWVFSSRCLTRIEGDRLGQLPSRLHPPPLDWNHDEPVHTCENAGPSGRVPVGWCSRRFLPVHVPVPPMTAKQAKSRPIADRRSLRQHRCPLWARLPVGYRVPIARISSSGRAPRHQHRFLVSLCCFRSSKVYPSPSFQIQRKTAGSSCRRRIDMGGVRGGLFDTWLSYCSNLQKALNAAVGP